MIYYLKKRKTEGIALPEELKVCSVLETKKRLRGDRMILIQIQILSENDDRIFIFVLLHIDHVSVFYRCDQCHGI